MNHPQFITQYTQNKPCTIQHALAWAGSFLRNKGLPDPRLSAELLLGSVIGLERPGLILHRDRSLDEKEGVVFQEKVLRRAEHEPVAYLVGQKEFWSLTFEVNPQVLIPRPETELLVEQTLGILSNLTGPITLVELGTGSGAVSIVLSKSLTHPLTTRLIATDISRETLRTAQKNAGLHGMEKTIHFVQGDWLRPFSSRSRWIDLMVSNPPYVSEKELLQLPTTVRKFEPLKALSGGRDGLEAIRLIFRQVVKQLKRGGWLILEIGESQGSQVLNLARKYHFNPITVLRDHAGKDRVLKACYHG
jgi:release factor glutamine methyltransferase